MKYYFFIVVYFVGIISVFPQSGILFPGENRETQNDYLLKTGVSIFPFNPMLVVEDSKAYFALTKEVSVVVGAINLKHKSILNRIGAEYSYIFREERKSHMRLFYSFDYPAIAEDFFALALSPGVGYFTDFKKSGAFPQISVNFFIPVTYFTAVNLYFKVRHNFVFQKNEKDVSDISLGLGLIFLP
jgi:hypothetical protein